MSDIEVELSALKAINRLLVKCAKEYMIHYDLSRLPTPIELTEEDIEHLELIIEDADNG